MREDVVQVGALGRVINYFESFLDFSTLKYGLLATAAAGVEATGAVGLGIVSSMALVGVLHADKVVHSDDFDLSRVSLIRSGAAVGLAHTTALEATIEKLLLPLELLVQFIDFCLLLLDQFLETVFELTFEIVFLFRSLGFPLLFLLLEIVDLLL